MGTKKMHLASTDGEEMEKEVEKVEKLKGISVSEPMCLVHMSYIAPVGSSCLIYRVDPGFSSVYSETFSYLWWLQ